MHRLMEDFSFIDAHVHVNSRSPDDFRRLAAAGCRAVVAAAGPEAGFSSTASLKDYFRRLHRVDRPRIEACGLDCYLALGIHPRAARGRALVRALGVMNRLLEEFQAAALGEVGLEEGGDLEKELLQLQLEIAREKDLPVILHTPRRNKLRALELSLELVQKAALRPARVLLDHLDEAVLELARSSGCWLGLSIHPAKLSPQQAAQLVCSLGGERLILSSDLGECEGWLFALPAAACAMEEQGVAPEVIKRVCLQNAREFLGR